MKCVNCNGLLESRSAKKFCSRSCSVSFHNKKNKKKHDTRTCPQCSAVVYHPKTYCSHACVQQFRLEKSIIDGTVAHRSLRRYLLQKGNSCSICGITEWCSKPIELEMDHIDGNATNNNLENVRLVCPNCHSQTPTFKNRNSGSGRAYRRKNKGS